jgi:hypothetical protein
MTTSNTKKHCGIFYEEVTPYSDETLVQVIKVKGNEYKLTFLPRPCKADSDLFAVFHNGIRYSTFAKFLKSL